MSQLNKQIQTLFESAKKIDDQGKEYWLARDLMLLLQYDQWKNFAKVIQKAIGSLANTYPHVEHHFAEIGKMIKVAVGTPKQATRQIKDYKLTRYACYLIAQNGDPGKQAVAYAQSYFAVQTRKQELFETKQDQIQRIAARKKLQATEKRFSQVLSQHGVDSKGIGEIRSAGDQALFNKSTREMKKALGADQDRPLADFVPTITLKAKDLATEMTTFQTKNKSLKGKYPIKAEHVHNNSEIRKLLNQNLIFPEQLPAEEDIKKLQSRLDITQINQLQSSDFDNQLELIIDISGVRNKQMLQVIKQIIDDNPGDTKLKVLYGDPDNLKMFTTVIQINPASIAGLKKYLVMSDK